MLNENRISKTHPKRINILEYWFLMNFKSNYQISKELSVNQSTLEGVIEQWTETECLIISSKMNK